VDEIWEDVNVWHAMAGVYIFFCVIIPKQKVAKLVLLLKNKIFQHHALTKV